MSLPIVIIFGRDTYDEPEPGLGLLLYEDGIRLYGTRFSHPRDPRERKRYYGITPLFSGRGLEDLLVFCERTAVEVPDEPWDGSCRLDLCQGFYLTSYPKEHHQKIHLFCEAFDSVYEEDRECWGATEVEIWVPKPAFRLFLVVLREIIVTGSVRSSSARVA